MALTKIDDRGVTYPLDLLDNEQIRFGTGNDLLIYHSGSESNIVDAGQGVLRIGSSQLNITNAALSETYAKFVANSYCELYYDNSPKIQTTGNGATVTTTNSTKSIKNITTSTSAPSGGSDGDLWFTYT